MEDGGRRDQEDEDGEGRKKKTNSAKVSPLVRISWAQTQNSWVSKNFTNVRDNLIITSNFMSTGENFSFIVIHILANTIHLFSSTNRFVDENSCSVIYVC